MRCQIPAPGRSFCYQQVTHVYNTRTVSKVIQPRLIPHPHERLVITQSNDLAGSIQDMVLTEKRVLILNAAVIRRADAVLPSVRVDLADYRRIFGIENRKLTQELKAIVPTITTRNIILKHGKSSTGSMSVFHKFLVVSGEDSETGRAYMVSHIHEDMAPFFLGLTGNFFSMPLLVYSCFRSNYSLRLAELLAADCRGDTTFNVTYSVGDLNERLGASSSYNFAQFRRRVLDPAKRENDGIGYLTFTWDEHRRGRSVTDVTFHVKLNRTTWKVDSEQEEIGRIAVANTLRQHGFTSIPDVYWNVLGASAVAGITKEAEKEVRIRERSDQPVRNTGGFIRSRLDAAVAAQQPIPIPLNPAAPQEKGTPKKLRDSQELYRLADELLGDYYRARTEHALCIFDRLPAESQEDLTARMLQDILLPAPTLIAPSLKPVDGGPLSEASRRMAIVRLLERDSLVVYRDHLEDVRTFTQSRQFGAEFIASERERIVAEAEANDRANG